MALQHLALDQINEASLQGLIDGQSPERRDIEYKKDTYGTADRDYGEYLADVSSFANTNGGDIVIGMCANAGVPTGLYPLNVVPDAEILRLENIVRSGLQARVHGLAVHPIPLSIGGFAFVVRIPRSYNQPHRVIRQGPGHHRFYARSSAGKYEPNVDELRFLFTRAPQIAERIRDFRFERIARISANSGPVPLIDTNALILHVVPFSAFDTRLSLPLHPVDRLYLHFPPIRSSHPSNHRINIDGLLTWSNAQETAREQRAYVQVFHSGIVEAVASSFPDGGGPSRRLTALKTEASIVKHTHQYLRALLNLGCEGPFAILVSLIGMSDVRYSFSCGNSVFEDEAGILDRDQLHFSELIVESVPADPYEYAPQLRPLLDQTANAAGRAATPSFDDSGRFRVKVD